MEPSESTLEVKITVERTEKILYAQSYEAIERHEIAVKTMVSDVNNCKRAVETTKIASKQDLGEIGDWVAEIENKLAIFIRSCD